MKPNFYPTLKTLIATCFCLPILFATADTPKPEGVVAIFKKHEGELVFKGMIKPDEWKKNLEIQLSEK